MKKKKNKQKGKKNWKKNLIYNIFIALLVIATIIFGYAIIVLDVLILKYMLILFGILLVINIINILLLKRGKKKLKIFAIICSILFSSGMLFASSYIFKTHGVLLDSNVEYKTYDFSVLVLKDSSYQKIDDLKEKTMGYYEIENVDSKDYLDKIPKKLNIKYEKHSSYSELTDSLTNAKVESIVIEDSYLNMLKEGEVSNFNEETRVIYTFSIKVKIGDISKDINVTKEPFNIYISGMDEYGSVTSVSRSDVNIVMTVNPKTKQILLTSIPRDYYVQLHGTSGYKDKLTHAGLYGVESSVNTIEDLLDVDINYYIKVNFTSLIKIIDAIGGVEVYSEYDFTSRDEFHYSKGYNKVNGEEALSFARERKAFSAGDNQRGKNQQALLEAIIRKCTNSSIIYKYNSLLNSITGSFITNMSTKRITSLIKLQLADTSSWNVTSYSLTGFDGSEYTYSYSNQKLYVMVPDEKSIEEAKGLITEVLNGDVLKSSYDKNSSDVHSVTKTTGQKSNTNSSNKNTSGNNVQNNNGSSNNTPKIEVNPNEVKKEDNSNVDTGNKEIEPKDQPTADISEPKDQKPATQDNTENYKESGESDKPAEGTNKTPDTNTNNESNENDENKSAENNN